jgi:thiamine-phosphate pyrophosphorylase
MLVNDDKHIRRADLADVVARAIAGGVDIVQLRARPLSHTALLKTGRALRNAIAGRAMLLVNSDDEAAVELDADGVHLPATGASVQDVRGRVGGSMLVSRAVHSAREAFAAEAEGADFIVLGTVFPSRSHPAGPTIGVDGVREVCRAVSIPVIAIGGITAQNAPEVMRAGASGVAVISAILDAPDPRAAAAELRAAIGAPVRT